MQGDAAISRQPIPSQYHHLRESRSRQLRRSTEVSQNWNPSDSAGQQQPPWGPYSQQDYYPQQSFVAQPNVQPNVQGNVQQPYPPYPPGYGQPQYAPPQMPPPRRPWISRHKFLTGLGALLLFFIFIGVGANLGSTKSNGTGASGFTATSQAAAPATSAAAAVKQSVTFVVTGSPADVTYGPSGTSVQGTVPMRVTKPLSNPVFYSLYAQLQGGGEVTCKILVDGKIISQSVASGGYNIAQCEISQDPLSGQWSDTNAA